MTWVAGVIAILAGLVMCFYGYRLFRVWLAVTGFIGGVYLGNYLGETYFTGEVWPVALAIGLGLLFALLAYFLYRLGAVLTGALLGAALVNALAGTPGGAYAGWPIAVGAILGAILAGMFLKPYLIIGSSLNGAYFSALGAYSLVVMEDMTQDLFKQDLPWYVLLCVLVLAAFGVIAQFRLNKGREIGDMVRKKPHPRKK
ncbi:MAG TPA: DUF4203 domain-containing protein [Feifaniaceae bacterium]|nr:DUF4203 domain-containing protein [Feifaniaceae bacterium]